MAEPELEPAAARCPSLSRVLWPGGGGAWTRASEAMAKREPKPMLRQWVHLSPSQQRGVGGARA